MAAQLVKAYSQMNLSTKAREPFDLTSDPPPPWGKTEDANFNSNSTYDGNFFYDLANYSMPYSEPMSPTLAAFDSAIRWMDYCFVPIVFTVGTIGNSLSFLVFVCSHVRRLSSSVYLAALAITDTGFLVCVFVSWANNIGIHWFHQPGWCQTFVYCTYIFSFLSVWYVVAFTVERYIAVCLPFQRQNMCTSKRAKIVVFALLALASILYNFAIWTSKVQMFINTPMCAPLPQYFELATWVTSIDSVFTLVVPCGVILVLNVRIVYAVLFITKQLRSANSGCTRSHQKQSSGLSSSINNGFKANVIVTSGGRNVTIPKDGLDQRQSRQNMAQVKVTKMLVIVSTTFLLLNLPSHVIRVYGLLRHFYTNDYKPSKMCLILQRFFMYIYYTNFSINFFLYAVCGRNFRHALFHSLRKVQYNVRKCVSRHRNASTSLSADGDLLQCHTTPPVNHSSKRKEAPREDHVKQNGTDNKTTRNTRTPSKRCLAKVGGCRTRSPYKGYTYKFEDRKL